MIWARELENASAADLDEFLDGKLALKHWVHHLNQLLSIRETGQSLRTNSSAG